MITLITGGQRSGKSRLAETILAEKAHVVYIATAEYNPNDAEMVSRIQKHQQRRNQAWHTVECYKNFHKHIQTGNSYLLDCVTNSVSRLLFDYSHNKEHLSNVEVHEIFEIIKNEFSMLIQTCKKEAANLVLVTNEVGSAIIPMHHISRVFVDLQGMTNSFLATLADEVFLCVSGIPVKIK